MFDQVFGCKDFFKNNRKFKKTAELYPNLTNTLKKIVLREMLLPKQSFYGLKVEKQISRNSISKVLIRFNSIFLFPAFFAAW